MTQEMFIRIARDKLEEWEKSRLIDGNINISDEDLSKALNIELIQTTKAMEIELKELINLDVEKLKNLPAGHPYASFSDLVRKHFPKTGLEE